MDLRRLQYFLAVAEDLHFGRAATRLGITQPALSQQIRRLELELGATLVDRTSRTNSLTRAGMLVLDPLQRCLAAYDEARSLAQSSEDTADRLRIGFPRGESSVMLAPFLRRIAHRFPNTRIEVFDMPCERQANALLDSSLDVGLMHLPVLEPALTPVVIRRDRLVVALPRNHPYAKDSLIEVQQLAEEPFIGVRLRCPAYAHALSLLARDKGFAPRIEYETSGIEPTLEMVASHLGLAIVPGSAVRPRDDVAIRGLASENRELSLAFVFHREKSSMLIKQFCSMVRTAVKENPPEPALTA